MTLKFDITLYDGSKFKLSHNVSKKLSSDEVGRLAVRLQRLLRSATDVEYVGILM